MDPDIDAVLDLVAKRHDVLRLLDGERVPKRRIVDDLEYSRSTVNRAVAVLADAGLVDDAPRGPRTTAVGSMLLARYDEYVASATDVLRGRAVLASLPPETDLDPIVLADAEVRTPDGSSPYEVIPAVEGLFGRAAGPVRVYVPTFTNPRGIDLARELAAVVDLEIVFDAGLLEELRADIPDDMAELFDLERFTGYETSTGPAYTVIVVTTESGPEGGVVIHTEARELAGCVVTGDPDAVRWLEARFSEIRADSERVDPPA